ncbi:acyltransferase [Curtobacterium sp. RHCJP20]|uniref:Acyltransferase n=1 Tax=Curtobacterium subtropicum TaxID=3055138 RepID=A0ABT7TDK6_9MICO|nr:acyltransferase [Curtobacterium subtropicum]MDM7887449.1 acyltransferase [Curtobacterium subtropicum]
MDFLDGIRGIAALVVVVEHALESWVDGYTQWSIDTINMGRVGIVAFFMVSGYVIGLTLTHQTIRTFAIRRFWRLYPVYWLATIVWILVDLPNTNPFSAYSLFVVVANITMLQGAIPGLVGILGPAWTLGAELVYYIQTAAAKRVGLLRRSVYLGYGWLAVFVAMGIDNVARGSTSTAIVPLMLFFASLGYSLYLRDANGSRTWIGLMGAAIVVVPALSLPLLSSQAPDQLSWSVIGFNASHFVGIAVFLVARALRSRSFPKTILWLGSVSYALYVIHASVIRGLEYADLPGVAAIPIVVVLSLASAWLLHRTLEVPSIALGRRLSTRSAHPRFSNVGTASAGPTVESSDSHQPVNALQPTGAPSSQSDPTSKGARHE